MAFRKVTQAWCCKQDQGLTPRLGARVSGGPVAWLPGFGTEAFLSYFLVPAKQL